jgi:hypothetical protein
MFLDGGRPVDPRLQTTPLPHLPLLGQPDEVNTPVMPPPSPD